MSSRIKTACPYFQFEGTAAPAVKFVSLLPSAGQLAAVHLIFILIKTSGKKKKYVTLLKRIYFDLFLHRVDSINVISLAYFGAIGVNIN